jgi:hypothetical protein
MNIVIGLKKILNSVRGFAIPRPFVGGMLQGITLSPLLEVTIATDSSVSDTL